MVTQANAKLGYPIMQVSSFASDVLNAKTFISLLKNFGKFLVFSVSPHCQQTPLQDFVPVSKRPQLSQVQ